jgi:hypothetical protein
MLDARMKAIALGRVNQAVSDARFYDDQANAQRLTAALLIRTWQLCPSTDGRECCLDPENCHAKEQL